MKTTVQLDDQLLAEAKQYTAQSGQTLTHLIEDALREVLARHQQVSKRSKVKLKTVAGLGTQPGVDLNDGASLLELNHCGRDL
ncbi:MAG: type II toxin-antitoxin system VapB family antitoxin [Thermosynechococcaceae cyanobacterium]